MWVIRDCRWAILVAIWGVHGGYINDTKGMKRSCRVI